MRKRRRNRHNGGARKDAEKYGLGPGSKPIDLLTMLVTPRGLTPQLNPKGMAGEGDYGVCKMSIKEGYLSVEYRPDVTIIGELRSQWHEVREAMLMLEKLDAGIPYDGKPRHRGGMFDTQHEIDVEGWAIFITHLCLFGDEAPDAEDASLGDESSYDSMLEELDP